MHTNWQQIRDKWPHHEVGKADACIVDVSQCVFSGEGKHELIVYTFGRYKRLAERQSASHYPVCIRFGIHYPDFVSNEEPAIAHIRGCLSHAATGMPERALLLAVISSENGRAYWDALWRELVAEPPLDTSCPSSRWVSSSVEKVLEAVERVSKITLPAFVEERPPCFCGVAISCEDIPPGQFVGYEPADSELSPTRMSNWVYPLKHRIRKGAKGRQTTQERVVLKEDLRRLHKSLYKGQLGWTVPDPGFMLRKGASSLCIEVLFDTGVRVLVDVYWIHFVRDECSRAVADKVIASYRNTPFDADSDVAARWHRDLPFYRPAETAVVGNGLDEVYAYSYASCMEEARLNGAGHYPMKIGYTSGVDGALERINGQFPRALAKDASVRFIGRCHNGRKTESMIQRHLKECGRKLDSAPGREWFSTNAAEVEEIFVKCRQ